MRVLVTGAAGRVGQLVTPELSRLGLQLRLLDVRPVPRCDDAIIADVRDGAALEAAMAGVDGVLHLAGIPREAPFAEICATNIAGDHSLFESARRAGVNRVVYASSIHAVGFTPHVPLLRTEVPPRPDTYYGASKVFGEALGHLYADRHRMQIACIRIGTCFARPFAARHLASWLSPGDAARLVYACLTAPGLDFAVVYGISANSRAWWDLEPARALGYEPQDDAETYAAEIDGELDTVDERYAGGYFTTLEP